jgi:hypothetical protein
MPIRQKMLGGKMNAKVEVALNFKKMALERYNNLFFIKRLFINKEKFKKNTKIH